MAAAHQNLPTRTATNITDDDAVPEEDTSEVTRLFLERLQAWKHACGYLEDYIGATEKMQAHHTKEYERVLKTVSSPLKEGHHFDQRLGGVAGLMDNLRSNTQGLANSHTETAKTIQGTVLPILERLHAEIKNKNKELTKGAGKGAKLVDKARNTTQKHVELLGQHTAAFDSTGGRVNAHEDPYVLQRGVNHRLNKQVVEENNNRQDLISVQNSFASFEAHILQTFQNAMNQFNQVLTRQADQTRIMYGDMAANAHAIRPDFEWQGFMQRNSGMLIDPSGPPRDLASINFPNQDHRSTQPMIAGSLERKSGVLKKYDTGYYVVTPSRYLHEYKTDDDFAKDPVPENSLYLPDCTIGALDGAKFNVKGKDASKGSLGNKFSMSHEFAFKAHTTADAEKWYSVITSVAGQTTNSLPSSEAGSAPASRVGTNLSEHQNAQTAGAVGGAGAVAGAGGYANHPQGAQTTTGQSGTAGLAQPGSAFQETGVTQPGYAQQSGVQPGVGQQGIAQTGVAHQGMGQPGVTQQGVIQPGVGQQGIAQPGLGQQGLATAEKYHGI